MSETIKLNDEETGEVIEFDVIEETRVNGVNYLLVTEAVADGEEIDDEEETAYILKDLSEAQDKDARLVFVEEENELDYISKIFAELLDDVDLEK